MSLKRAWLGESGLRICHMDKRYMQGLCCDYSLQYDVNKK